MKPANKSEFAKVNQYLVKNSIGLAIMGFLLIMGMATGISIIQIHYPFIAAYELASLPSILYNNANEYVMYTIISILTHCVFFSMLFLSSRWGPFCIFLPISIFFRGLMIGVAMRSVLMMQQGVLLIITLIILQVDFAFILVPTLVIGLNETKNIKHKFFKTSSHILTAETNSASSKTTILLCASLLLLSITIEGMIMPLAMRAFG